VQVQVYDQVRGAISTAVPVVLIGLLAAHALVWRARNAPHPAPIDDTASAPR
jgi:hypothetical protein